MIVVRRGDVEPGGRYAGARFAPVFATSVTDLNPSPGKVREESYQRIQDAGYLRARRRTDPETARARPTVDTFERFMEELAPTEFEPRERQRHGITARYPSSQGRSLEDSHTQADGFTIPAVTSGNPYARTEGLEFHIAQTGAASGDRFDRIRRFLNWLDRTERGRKARERKATETQQRDLQLEIENDVAQKFKKTNKSKVEIELKDIAYADGSASAIREFTRLWRQGTLTDTKRPNATVQLNLRALTEREVSGILKKTGFDLRGYRHAIDTQGLSHTFRKHGPGNEKRKGQLPIDENSVSLYLEVVSDPANIVEASATKSGKPAILYRKHINGYVVFLEQVSIGKKTLSLHTHYLIRRNP